jgi:cysteine synthase A
VHLKLGAQNPTGSDKDRAALAWVRQAEADGRLGPGVKLVLASSGNLGISLGWLCASRKVPLTVVMPDSLSLERRALLKAYGVELVLTRAEDGMAGARARAKELGSQTGAWVVDPFEDALFEKAYADGLASELMETARLDGGRLDAVVAGVGSGAILSGLVEALSVRFPRSLVVAVQPAAAPGKLHRLQELGTGVESARLEKLKAHRIIQVSDADARAFQLRLGREEGILAGISTGAVALAAVEVARGFTNQARVYALSIDTGERDFSLAEQFA